MKTRTAIFLVIFLAIATTFIISPSLLTIPMASLYLIFPVGAALIAIYSSRIYRLNSANGRVMILITAGLVFWGIAETMGYISDNFITADNLAPQLPDLFFLLAYPLLGAGIYQGFITASIRLGQVKKSLLIAVFSIALILTILEAYFGIYMAYDPSADPLTSIINISYGLGDLILVILSMLAILVSNEYKGGKLASFWKIMSLGFFVFLVGDTMFFRLYGDLLLADVKPYTYLIELSWIAAYLILAYGMLDNYIHVSEIQKKIRLKLAQK